MVAVQQQVVSKRGSRKARASNKPGISNKPAASSASASKKPSTLRIHEAAERVFAKQGYGATSLRDLIAESGMSTTAFYARFASKEDVLDAVIHELFTHLTWAASETLAGADGIDDGFDRGVDALVEVLAPRKGLVRLALTEAACSRRSLRTLQQSFGALALMLSQRVMKLVERGDADVEDADAVGWALVGALKMQVTRWAVYEEIDDTGLIRALESTARAMLPVMRRRRGRR